MATLAGQVSFVSQEIEHHCAFLVIYGSVWLMCEVIQQVNRKSHLAKAVQLKARGAFLFALRLLSSPRRKGEVRRDGQTFGKLMDAALVGNVKLM